MPTQFQLLLIKSDVGEFLQVRNPPSKTPSATALYAHLEPKSVARLPLKLETVDVCGLRWSQRLLSRVALTLISGRAA